MLLEILIEYSIEDLREPALSRGFDIDDKTRGDLIGELLDLEEGTIAFWFNFGIPVVSAVLERL